MLCLAELSGSSCFIISCSTSFNILDWWYWGNKNIAWNPHRMGEGAFCVAQMNLEFLKQEFIQALDGMEKNKPHRFFFCKKSLRGEHVCGYQEIISGHDHQLHYLHVFLCRCRNPTNPVLAVSSWGNLPWCYQYKTFPYLQCWFKLCQFSAVLLSNPATSGETWEWTMSGRAICLIPCFYQALSPSLYFLTLYRDVQDVTEEFDGEPQLLSFCLIPLSTWISICSPDHFLSFRGGHSRVEWGGCWKGCPCFGYFFICFSQKWGVECTFWGYPLSQGVAAPKEGATSAASGQNLWHYPSWSHSCCVCHSTGAAHAQNKLGGVQFTDQWWGWPS